MDKVRRSVLIAQIVVETSGTAEEHERARIWAVQRVKSAHMHVREAAIAIRVTGSDGKQYGFVGHGEELSKVSLEIIDDFFATPEQAPTE